MQRVFLIPLVFIIFNLLPGCAVTKIPQSAEEFRKIHPVTISDKMGVFYVQREFNSVANSFRNMGPFCLRKKVRSVSGYLINYNPTVIKTKNKVELELQHESIERLSDSLSKPKGGYYLLVADAFRMSKGRTKVNIYFTEAESGAVARVVKAWAKGAKSCPDLTKL